MTRSLALALSASLLAGCGGVPGGLAPQGAGLTLEKSADGAARAKRPAPRKALSAASCLKWDADFGQHLNVWDDSCFELPVGFTFSFYGTDYTRLFVGSNGYITFGRGDTSYFSYSPLTSGLARIAPLFGDLVPNSWNADSDVYFKTVGAAPNRRFVATWVVMPEYSDRAAINTFQVQLFEGTNEIMFGYNGLGTDGYSAIGLPYTAGLGAPSGASLLTAQGRDLKALEGVNVLFRPDGRGGYSQARLGCEEPALAVATAPPQSGLEGQPVAFSAAASNAAGPVSYAWDFGDGATAEGAQVAHAYADNGAYHVTVRATDGNGKTATAEASAAIANVAPTVRAPGAVTITSGESAALAAGFSDPGAQDGPWAWTIDWGNGASAAGTAGAPGSAVSAARRYLKAGSYAVSLSVTDKDAGVGTAQTTVTVLRLAAPADVKPGSPDNPIALDGKGGQLPVALLSVPGFDATQVDPASVRIGLTGVAARNDGALMAASEDVDGDGDLDLLLHFERAQLQANGDLSASTTQLTLLGDLRDGRQFRAVDGVRVLPVLP
jgi:PKD repeat protein